MLGEGRGGGRRVRGGGGGGVAAAAAPAAVSASKSSHLVENKGESKLGYFLEGAEELT